MKLISYLNMHRARLGYVNCVLLAADVQLDTSASLRRRLDKMLFENVVFADSPEFQSYAAEIDPVKWQKIDEQSNRRALRRSKRTRRGILPGGLPEEAKENQGPTQSSYAPGDLWIHQRNMRSELGRVLPEDSDEPIELAKDLGMLSESYALTEFGNVAKAFLLERLGGETAGISAFPNPLEVYGDFRLRLMYLYALLREDVVFIALLDYISATHSLSDCLRKSLDLAVGKLEENVRLDEVGELRSLSVLHRRISKDPVDKAQRVPRLEFMVDLGLLNRQPASDHSDSQYAETEATGRLRSAFNDLFVQPASSVSWLDSNFFHAAGVVYGQSHEPVASPERRLLYFVRGAAVLGKRMGFIPGRAASLAACALALSEGFHLEISELFTEVYSVPKTRWSEFVKFSGGSRLDNEFLVAIDPSLESLLSAALQDSGRD